MSALARLAVGAGYTVSGSDRDESPTLAALRALGVTAHAGHAAGHLPTHLDALVVSSAVPATNPELAAAGERGVPVLHRSQFLAELMEGKRGVAVAGAHGKSTTSAMLATALGEDASACVGATIAGGRGTGARWGGGPWFAVEADESDRSLLNLRPQAAILLNVDHDHHATYASLNEVREVFRRFIALLPPDGLLVVGPDAEARACASQAPCAVLSVGDHPGASASVVRVPGAGGFTLRFADGREVVVPLAVSGLHNATNAACALVVADWCGVPLADAAGRLAGFSGVGRRMEERGRVGNIRVVDDYAHHPAEIAATLAGARELGAERIVVLFQPHLPSRTRALTPELGASLGGADVAIVTDVYLSRERPDPLADGRLVAAAIPAATRSAFAATLPEALERALVEIRPGDLVITMGAGDITTLGQELVARLQKLYPDGALPA